MLSGLGQSARRQAVSICKVGATFPSALSTCSPLQPHWPSVPRILGPPHLGAAVLLGFFTASPTSVCADGRRSQGPTLLLMAALSGPRCPVPGSLLTRCIPPAVCAACCPVITVCQLSLHCGQLQQGGQALSCAWNRQVSTRSRQAGCKGSAEHVGKESSAFTRPSSEGFASPQSGCSVACPKRRQGQEGSLMAAAVPRASCFQGAGLQKGRRREYTRIYYFTISRDILTDRMWSCRASPRSWPRPAGLGAAAA